MSSSRRIPKFNSTQEMQSGLINPLYIALQKLVDETKNQTEVEEGFIVIAKLLLLQTTFRVAEKSYQLMDVEFYFYNEEIHPDPYSHSHQYANAVRQKQSVTGAWYFHRFTGMAKYTHTRRGLDITYGDGDRQRWGGILIRSMKSLENNRIIRGPSRVVAEIINAVDNSEALEKIAFNMQAGLAFDPESSLFIDFKELSRELPVYSTTRFGLNDKNPIYQQKHYRFSTDDNLFKKSTDVKSL